MASGYALRVARERDLASSTPIPTSPTCSTPGELERARREALARVSAAVAGRVGRAGGARAPTPPPRLPDRRRAAQPRGRRARPPLRRADRARRRACGRGSGTTRARTCRRRSAGRCSSRRALAVLDHGLVERIVPWPQLGLELFNRGTRRAHHLAVALAIAHHQRVDDRLLLTLWHLAERWGRVHADGIVVPLPLGHQRLADLVGAHRQSVTTRDGRARRAAGRSAAATTATGCCTASRRSSCATTSSPRSRPRSRQTSGSPPRGERPGVRRLEPPRIEPDHGGAGVLGAVRPDRGGVVAGGRRRGAEDLQAWRLVARSSTHAAAHSATATSCAGSQYEHDTNGVAARCARAAASGGR